MKVLALWPQIVMGALLLAGLLLELRNHGKPKDEDHDFYISLVAAGLVIFILYKGGFWG